MTLMSDDGFVVPIALEASTARHIVAAVVLQAFRDVETMDTRRAKNPEAKPKARKNGCRTPRRCGRLAIGGVAMCCAADHTE